MFKIIYLEMAETAFAGIGRYLSFPIATLRGTKNMMETVVIIESIGATSRLLRFFDFEDIIMIDCVKKSGRTGVFTDSKPSFEHHRTYLLDVSVDTGVIVDCPVYF